MGTRWIEFSVPVLLLLLLLLLRRVFRGLTPGENLVQGHSVVWPTAATRRVPTNGKPIGYANIESPRGVTRPDCGLAARKKKKKKLAPSDPLVRFRLRCIDFAMRRVSRLNPLRNRCEASLASKRRRKLAIGHSSPILRSAYVFKTHSTDTRKYLSSKQMQTSIRRT